MMRIVEPRLFDRHRVYAWVAVVALFILATAGAVLNGEWIEEAGQAQRRQAAAEEAVRLKADFEANQAAIAAAIRADLAAGRLGDADALLQKYRPVANGALDALSALYESRRLAAAPK